MSGITPTQEAAPPPPTTREALLMAQEFLHAWASSIEEPDDEACNVIDAVDSALAITPPSNPSSNQ